jgi:signal transduction histidine kinase
MAVANFKSASIRKAVNRLLSAQAGALAFGFAGLLLLMAVMAIDATRSLRSVEVTPAALRTESRGRDSLLDQVRVDIYRSATIERDYLMELDGARAESQKADLKLLDTRIEDTLRTYQQKLPASEKDAFEDLHRGVESYWKSASPALQWNAAERRARGGSFLRDFVVPQRKDVVQLTKQVTALNERDLDAGEDRIRAVQSRFLRRAVLISIFALVLGLVLASVSIRRVRRLEREAKARYEEVEEARHELVKLSHRLVTAQEEERRNLSRELHDEIGQTMSAMLIELGRIGTATDDQRQATWRGNRCAELAFR